MVKTDKKFKNKFLQSIVAQFKSEDVLWESEIEANMVTNLVLLISAVLLALRMIAGEVGAFPQDNHHYIRITCIEGIIELMIPFTLCNIFRGSKKWLKYVSYICFVSVAAIYNFMFSYSAVLVIAIPTVLSIRYLNKKFTGQVAILTVVLFVLSSYFSISLGVTHIDLNYVTPIVENIPYIGDLAKSVVAAGYDKSDYMFQMMVLELIPRLLLYGVIAFISLRIAQRGKEMVLEQAEITQRTSRIQSELNTATDIQANMLPSIFPAFPKNEEFDVYASMQPAKEVGGDFYDMFMIGDTKIAIVIADVSGKGVPAALFMVIAKSLIKNYAQMGLDAGDVFTKANAALCEGNQAGLFVTAWMAIIDIKSGDVSYVNAGHNPPIIQNNEGKFEYLKTRPGFVLAGMEDMKYKQYNIKLQRGDKILLYTDGVTEATNKDNDMYGEERLLDFINNHKGVGAENCVKALKKELDDFYAGYEQFDDITMLAFEFYGPQGGLVEYSSRKFDAKREELDNVNRYVEESLKKYNVSLKHINQILLCVEEIFINVASYAYKGADGKIEINIIPDKESVRIVFKDSGVEFNPLAKEDADTTLSAEERDIGGLGILMVKKTADTVRYKYVNGQNIFSFTKDITK